MWGGHSPTTTVNFNLCSLQMFSTTEQTMGSPYQVIMEILQREQYGIPDNSVTLEKSRIQKFSDHILYTVCTIQISQFSNVLTILMISPLQKI